jgi:hypothetical protein
LENTSAPLLQILSLPVPINSFYPLVCIVGNIAAFLNDPEVEAPVVLSAALGSICDGNHLITIVRFEVNKALAMKNAVFWYVTPSGTS